VSAACPIAFEIKIKMPLKRAELVLMLARGRGSCKARILSFLARLHVAASP